MNFDFLGEELQKPRSEERAEKPMIGKESAKDPIVTEDFFDPLRFIGTPSGPPAPPSTTVLPENNEPKSEPQPGEPRKLSPWEELDRDNLFDATPPASLSAYRSQVHQMSERVNILQSEVTGLRELHAWLVAVNHAQNSRGEAAAQLGDAKAAAKASAAIAAGIPAIFFWWRDPADKKSVRLARLESMADQQLREHDATITQAKTWIQEAAEHSGGPLLEINSTLVDEFRIRLAKRSFAVLIAQAKLTRYEAKWAHLLQPGGALHSEIYAEEYVKNRLKLEQKNGFKK